jgi:hypothetical protein
MTLRNEIKEVWEDKTIKILTYTIIVLIVLMVTIVPFSHEIYWFFKCQPQGYWCIDNGPNSCVGIICGCQP